MRTTVTLDPDVAATVKQLMRDEDIGFKVAVNRLIREATQPRTTERFVTRTYNMGVPAMNLDKALSIAFALDDEKLIEDMRHP